MNNIFRLKYGIIVACDMQNIKDLERTVKATCNLSFIQGYKIGMEFAVEFGIKNVTSILKKYTKLPIIYDHQKLGTDIPEISSGRILDILKSAGVDSVIIFPQAGIETLKATIKGCIERGLLPITGGEMTHKGYLQSEGGYIADSAPERMYEDAAKLGSKHFVIPGTKIDKMKQYKEKLSRIIESPVFLFPGIGKGQGGDILEAFNAVKPFNSYAIVGRGIYSQENPKIAAINLWGNVAAQLNL
jgi:orotidine-5'-phosphate decarboxylase